MTFFTFTVGAQTAGQAYQIVDEGGSTVASGTVPTSPTAPGEISFAVEVDGAGPFYVKGPGISQSEGARYAGIAASGGGGTTAETAKFIGTATGDTSGDEHTLTFAADGPMPDGFSINEDGEILYTGLVIVETIDTRYTVRLDFTGATGFSNTVKPPDSDVTMYFASDVEDFGHNIAGPYVPALLDDPGPVFDLDAANKLVTQSKRTAGNLFLRLFGTINANGYDEAGEQVSDGVVTGALAVWITLATLPDSPDLPA